MKEKTYSILLNVKVVHEDEKRRGYIISGWPGAIASESHLEEFYPFNYQKDEFMKDLGRMILKIIESEVDSDEYWIS